MSRVYTAPGICSFVAVSHLMIVVVALIIVRLHVLFSIMLTLSKIIDLPLPKGLHCALE